MIWGEDQGEGGKIVEVAFSEGLGVLTKARVGLRRPGGGPRERFRKVLQRIATIR